MNSYDFIKLPNEILISIFQYCEITNKNKIKLLNKYFYNLILDYFKINVNLHKLIVECGKKKLEKDETKINDSTNSENSLKDTIEKRINNLKGFIKKVFFSISTPTEESLLNIIKSHYEKANINSIHFNKETCENKIKNEGIAIIIYSNVLKHFTELQEIEIETKNRNRFINNNKSIQKWINENKSTLNILKIYRNANQNLNEDINYRFFNGTFNLSLLCNLTVLELTSLPVSSIIDLNNLILLEKLKLNNLAIKEIRIDSLLKLKKLDITDNMFLDTIYIGEKITNLNNIIFNSKMVDQNFEKIIIFPNIPNLKIIGSITSISINEENNSFSSLFKNVINLTIEIRDKSKFKLIEKIIYEKCFKSFCSLTSLTLINYNINFRSSLKTPLKIIKILYNDNIIHSNYYRKIYFQGCKAIKDLESLYILGNINSVDLSNLKECENLKFLEIDCEINKIKNIMQLYELRNLEKFISNNEIQTCYTKRKRKRKFISNEKNS